MLDQRLEIANAVGQLLKDRKQKIAVAESSAGGLIAASLLAVPGASRYFVAGSVVYTLNARDVLMGISDEKMEGKRSSSEPYAALLAEQLIERHATDWSIAETGAAGPTGNRYGDPAGHTCIAVGGPITEVHTVRTDSDNRAENMWAFAAAALQRLHDAIART